VGRLPDDTRLTPLSARPAVPAHDELVKHGSEAVQFDQVRRGQLGQDALALGGEANPDEPRISRVRDPADQACAFCSVDELYRAVVSQQQVAGQVTNRRRQPAWMALDRDQQLVLHVGEPGGLGLVLTPALEAAQAGAERQQVLEVIGG
jgi:hypothetical protein